MGLHIFAGTILYMYANCRRIAGNFQVNKGYVKFSFETQV